jgi:hypothetical protein
MLTFIMFIPQVRSSTIMQNSPQNDNMRYYLEVTGPLLPSNCLRLIEVIRSVHQKASVFFTTVDETTAFNAVSSEGIHTLCHSEGLRKKALRQIEWTAEGFHSITY